MQYSPVTLSMAANNRTWRPWPLRAWFFAIFTVICIALAVAVELIMRGCAPNGCRVFGSPPDLSHVTTETTFMYKHLPTIISVIFVLLWAVVHHDLLRLEPYFQMSKPGGAKASDSIFLEYPYTFSFYLVFESCKRGHLVVFLSSCLSILASFLITPLASGLFDDRQLIKYIPTNGTRNALYPGKDQDSLYTAGYSHLAYDYAWLNGSLPPFTTADYALLPVLPSEPPNEGLNATWVVETLLFEVDLPCEPAVITPILWDGVGQIGLNISSKDTLGNFEMWDDGVIEAADNVTVRDIIDEFPTAGGSRWRYETPWMSYGVPIVGEKETGYHMRYMYIWASSADPVLNNTLGGSTLPREYTAVVCDPAYYTQSVNAEITMSTGKVGRIERFGSRTFFNETTNFTQPFVDQMGLSLINSAPTDQLDTLENLVGLGYIPPSLPNVNSQLQRRFGSSDVPLLSSDSLKGRSNIYVPNYSLMAFSLYNQTTDTLRTLLDPQVLARTMEDGLKLLFALLVSADMVDDTVAEPVNFMRSIEVRGFQVNTLWARGVQAGLAVLAVMTAVIGVLSTRRKCELDGEPNSLAAVLRMLAASPEVGAEIQNAEFHKPFAVRRVLALNDQRYRLELVPGQGPRIRIVEKEAITVGLSPPEHNEPEKIFGKGLWQLRIHVGVAFMAFFAIVATLLAVAYGTARTNNGLPTFSPPGSFRYKVVYSFIPLAIGMATEPILLTLASIYCMLGPYTTLDGGPRSVRSLTIDYDKSPPHFQFIRALRVGDVALTCLSVGVLLCNVFTVALAGLFSPTDTELRMAMQMQTQGSPLIQGQFTVPAQEMYYVLSGTLTYNLSQPLWLTNDYYVLPINLTDTPIDGLQGYEGPTYGFGADIKCDHVPAANSTFRCQSAKNGTNFCAIQYGRPSRYQSLENTISIDDPCWAFGSTDSTELLWHGPTMDTFVHSASCPNTFFAIWIERPADPHRNDSSKPYKEFFDSVILKCTSTEKIVRLTASVNKDYQVLNTTDVRPLELEEMASLYTKNSTHLIPTFLDTLNAGIREEFGLGPHSLVWLDYLLAISEPRIVRHLTNVTHIPDKAYIATTVEDIFRRLFAVNLQLYGSDILALGETEVVEGEAEVMIKRVHVSDVMFTIAIIILLYVIAVLIMLYWGKKPTALRHPPVSLVGMYTLLYASNAKEECGKVQGSNPAERAERVEEYGGRYAYGRFQGEDETVHIGVFRVEEDELNHQAVDMRGQK